LSPAIYNAKSELAVVCPITNQVKGYPFEVSIPPGVSITGVILVDQIRTIDWVSRAATIKGKCPQNVFQDVQRKLRLLLP
jgi:mRNA interferase MazF